MDTERCSKCNSTMTYVRIKTNERVCRSCGKTVSININEKEVNEDETTKNFKQEQTE